MKILETTNTSEQTNSTNTALNLGSITRKICCNTFSFSGTSITLNAIGFYYITFIANITGLAVGNATIDMLSNGTQINGATSSTTISTINNVATLTFTKIIRVFPNTPQIITFINNGVEITTNSIIVDIIKVA